MVLDLGIFQEDNILGLSPIDADDLDSLQPK